MDMFLGVLFTIVCILLIVVVLLQKGRGGGLGAAFGGAGSSAFGTRTGDVFTWITIVLTALFLLLAVVSTLAFRPPPITIARPVINPSGGEIDAPKLVSITCQTRGAKIAFTVDGTDPKARQATGDRVTVTVRPGQTIKAQAYYSGSKPSEIASAVFTQKAAPAPASEAPTTATTPAADNTEPAGRPE